MRTLPPPNNEVARGIFPDEKDHDAFKWLMERVKYLESKVQWQQNEYAKLQEIYTKLADCWNAFQSTTKPIQRDVHRAEAAGEMARRLAEMILRLVYSTGGWQDLLEVLNRLGSQPPYEGARPRSPDFQLPPGPRK